MGLLLTIITFVPLLGALAILLIPKSQERLIKYLSIAISVIPFGLATWLWFAYDKAAGGIQFETIVSWIPTLNVNYHLGADGLSIPLIFLTALLTLLSMIYSTFTVTKRVKEFFLLFFLLEMGMLGVFVSLDLVLFYVFWEIGLVPDVPAHRHLGPTQGPPAILRHQVLPLHPGRQRLHDAGHPGPLLLPRHL